jgi:hypothetical protein
MNAQRQDVLSCGSMGTEEIASRMTDVLADKAPEG